MTNAKEKAAEKSKSCKPKKPVNNPNKNTATATNTTANSSNSSDKGTEWKKVANVTECISVFKDATKEKRRKSKSYGTIVHIRAKNNHTHTPEQVIPEDSNTVEKDCEKENGAEKRVEVETEEENKCESSEMQVKQQSPKSDKPRRRSTAKITAAKLEPALPEGDATSVLKNSIYQSIKNAFGLAFTDDEQLKITVDNIFPLLKSLGLNPQSEEVVDLVREASIETFGDIDLADFENVILGMVKEMDETLWDKRLGEKEMLHREREAAKAQAEANRLRLEQERKKAGFAEEVEDCDEWQEYENKLKEAAEKREKEIKEDELYDNLRMAFKFIDADEDGVISTQDLYVLMMGLGEMLTDDELFGMVNMADVDCDGKVTFEDFKKFLLPQSGDESLILSPAALAQQLLLSVPLATNISDVSGTNGESEEQNEKELVTENSGNGENAPETVENKTTLEEQEKTKADKKEESAPELTEEEKALRQKRRQSMLWGYMNTPKPSPDSRRNSILSPSSTVDEVFDETDSATKDQDSEAANIGSVIETEDNSDDDNHEKFKASTPTETAGLLDAIREEDEHSNYDAVNDHGDGHNNVNNNAECKVLSSVEHKRNLFSRQSSSASLKTKVTDSFGDSGIETMDSVNCSEIRDQPDVFDISDAEMEGEKDKESRRVPSVKDIYDANEDDEDMIDPLRVHESLSRVSSSDSILKLDLDSDDRLPKDSSEDYSEERVRNFVNEHTYIEIKPTPTPPSEEEIVRQEELKREAEERLSRAQVLEKAILSRSFTAPSLTCYKSTLQRPQTARPSVNGISCSHIDIDLRCDAPPKADIKSIRQFKERINSARSSRREKYLNLNKNEMSVVDISEMINSEENGISQTSRPKWPMRPLTRPRSPIARKLFNPSEKRFSLDLEMDEFERISTDRESRVRRRAQSAVASRRSCSPSLVVTGEGRNKTRPQTASLSYTSSRLEHDKERDVLVVEPLSNADALYPNKTTLTKYHHGFKSIWPIGRKINLIQAKRPFQAFEMNSYSRSIERSQFPFKGDHSIKITTQIPDACIGTPKILTSNKNVIKLEMETEPIKRPAIRKLSLYMTPNSTPRAVR